MAIKSPAVTAEEFASWLCPRDAHKFLDHLEYSTATRAIISRAQNGLLRAYAEVLVRQISGKPEPEPLFEIIPRIWQEAGTEFRATDFWASGDVTVILAVNSLDHQRTSLSLYGVRFERAGLQRMRPDIAEPQITTALAAAPPAKPTIIPAKGGRPAKEWWDDLWVEMCRQIYAGDLEHGKQATIEQAMADWVSAQGYDAGEATIRRAARKLFAALGQEDQKDQN